jgi:hypothetical protein
MLKGALMSFELRWCERIVSGLTCVLTLALGVAGGDGTGVDGWVRGVSDEGGAAGEETGLMGFAASSGSGAAGQISQ